MTAETRIRWVFQSRASCLETCVWRNELRKSVPSMYHHIRVTGSVGLAATLRICKTSRFLNPAETPAAVGVTAVRLPRRVRPPQMGDDFELKEYQRKTELVCAEDSLGSSYKNVQSGKEWNEHSLLLIDTGLKQFAAPSYDYFWATKCMYILYSSTTNKSVISGQMSVIFPVCSRFLSWPHPCFCRVEIRDTLLLSMFRC